MVIQSVVIQSPLPVCGKVFIKLIFNEMFQLSIENELISPNQLVFKPGDSFINQLLAITHGYTNHLMKALNLQVFF